MDHRITQEIELLKKEYPDVESKSKDEIVWILIPNFPISQNIWNKDKTSICFQIPSGYPGNPPYGFYVEGELRVKDTEEKPESYEEPAETPFNGTWGKFSWAHDDSWRATADFKSGSNLLNFVRSFPDRLNSGK